MPRTWEKLDNGSQPNNNSKNELAYNNYNNNPQVNGAAVLDYACATLPTYGKRRCYVTISTANILLAALSPREV